MISFFSSLLSSVKQKISGLFAHSTVNAAMLTELKDLLLSADVGFVTTQQIVSELELTIKQKNLTQGAEAQQALKTILIDKLGSQPVTPITPIMLLVGVNGSGKTTCAAKIAHLIIKQGGNPLVIAADTFRAAAVEQLADWGTKTGFDVHTSSAQDPASVVFDGCTQFIGGDYTHLIIDTAGRLQTKVNLMKELEKIGRIIQKQCPGTATTTLLTIDAMLGQNSFEQARIFNESTTLNGLILTKCDGTGKAGVVFAIKHMLNIPIIFICHGESIDAISPFDATAFVNDLLGIN